MIMVYINDGSKFKTNTRRKRLKLGLSLLLMITIVLFASIYDSSDAAM